MFHRTEGAGRRLKGASRTEVPSNLVYICASTYIDTSKSSRLQTVRRLRYWCAYGERYQDGKVSEKWSAEGRTGKELWHALECRQRPRNPLWIFGLDLGSALTVLDFWKALDDGTFTLGPVKPRPGEERVRGGRPWKGNLCVEASPVFAQVMGKEGKLNIVDVLNYYPVGAKSLADALAVECPKHPSDVADESAHRDYCMMTCNLLANTMRGLLHQWKKLDGGPWQKTSASLSLASYRRHCKRRENDDGYKPIVFARDEQCERLEREGYYGGRTEPLFVGKSEGLFWKLDVSSLYPSIMLGGLFPHKRIGRHTNLSPERLWRELGFRDGIATVDVDSLSDTYPLRHNGQLTFARGRFTTTLAGAELKRAVRNRHVIRCHEACVYETADLFSDWVRHWFGIKDDATRRGQQGQADRVLAKMVLNSLYGKFAQHGERWETIPGGACRVDRWGAWTERFPSGSIVRCRAIANNRQERIAGEPPAHYFPAIAAMVTAAARERLRELLSIVPERSCYYIATDMLIVDKDGFDALNDAGEIAENQIGKLQIQGIANSIEVVSPNWYRFGAQWVRSGGWGQQQAHDTKTPTYCAADRLPSILATEPDGSVIVRQHPLSAHERWAKGVVSASGWVEPFTLSSLGHGESKAA